MAAVTPAVVLLAAVHASFLAAPPVARGRDCPVAPATLARALTTVAYDSTGARRDPDDGSPSCDSVPFRARMRRNALSMTGLPGLVHVPVADVTPSGTADFSYDNARTPSVITNLARQRNVFIAFGFLPRVMIAGRGTVAVDTLDPAEIRDLSANVQLEILTEGAVSPAVSVGVQDIGHGATPFFPTRYLVASKTVLGRARLTGGYGTGPVFLKGPFGGLEVEAAPWATLLGEYDGRAFNGGLRIFPLPSMAARIGVQPRVDAVWRQGIGFATAVGFRTTLGGARTSSTMPAPTASLRRAESAPGPSPATASPPDTGMLALQRDLVARGFENVRAAIAPGARGRTVAVEYENRRFNRDELDALGIVMGVTALHSPGTVTRMRVTIRRVDIPVLTLESDVDAFIAFINDRLSDASFAAQLRISSPSVAERPDDAVASGPAANPSRWKLDLFIRPRIETTVLTDLGALDGRVSALPEADVQLGRGLVLDARRAIPVTESHGFPTSIEDPNGDRLLLHQALPIPLGGRWSGANALTQFSVGRFGHDAVGFANEVDVTVDDGLITLGSTVAVFGSSLGNLDRSMALAVARVRHPGLDLTASLTAGRFRNGDTGAAADLSRLFGATEVGFYVRATEFASIAGVRVVIPVTTTRELPPAHIRPRLPDVYSQTLQSAILEPLPALRMDVGLGLGTDHELGRVYRDRDRLQAATILAHVGTLRGTVRKWMGRAMLRN